MNAIATKSATATRKWTRSGSFKRLSTSREAIEDRALRALYLALNPWLKSDLPAYEVTPQKQASACTAAFRVGSCIVTVAISYETVIAFIVFDENGNTSRVYRTLPGLYSRTTDRFLREFARGDLVITYSEESVHAQLRETLGFTS